MFVIPAIDMAKTGQNIIVLRKRAGLTVKDLQGAFGFGTPQAIYKWQRGMALPSIDNLAALAVLLGVKIDDILVMDVDDQDALDYNRDENDLIPLEGKARNSKSKSLNRN